MTSSQSVVLERRRAMRALGSIGVVCGVFRGTTRAPSRGMLMLAVSSKLSGSGGHLNSGCQMLNFADPLVTVPGCIFIGTNGSADRDWRLQRRLLSRPVEFGCNVPAEPLPISAMTVVLNTRRAITAIATLAGSVVHLEAQAMSRPRADALAYPRPHSHIFAAE